MSIDYVRLSRFYTGYLGRTVSSEEVKTKFNAFVDGSGGAPFFTRWYMDTPAAMSCTIVESMPTASQWGREFKKKFGDKVVGIFLSGRAIRKALPQQVKADAMVWQVISRDSKECIIKNLFSFIVRNEYSPSRELFTNYVKNNIIPSCARVIKGSILSQQWLMKSEIIHTAMLASVYIIVTNQLTEIKSGYAKRAQIIRRKCESSCSPAELREIEVSLAQWERAGEKELDQMEDRLSKLEEGLGIESRANSSEA